MLNGAIPTMFRIKFDHSNRNHSNRNHSNRSQLYAITKATQTIAVTPTKTTLSTTTLLPVTMQQQNHHHLKQGAGSAA